VLLVFLLALACSGLWLVGAAGAYVAGEGLWSKAQKDAVFALRRYTRSRSPEDYDRFLSELRVPLADREARIELQKPHPDLNLACQALIRGRNHPGEVRRMALLFRWLHSESHLRRAIAIWTQGDRYISELRILSETLHGQVSSGSPDEFEIERLSLAIDAVNDRLTPLENEFSRTLGEGTRFAQRVAFAILPALTTLLIAVGVLISGILLRKIGQADRQYRDYLACADDGILVTERDTGVILEANRRAATMAGLSPEQLAGQRLQDFIQSCGSSSQNGHSEFRDSVLHREDGGEVRVDIRSSIARIHDTEVRVSIVRDVTEQRRFQERSAEAVRMEALGRLAGGIAHDFNNLLAGIMIYSSEARPHVRNVGVREAFDQIQKAARSGAGLIQHLLAFSRNQPITPQLFDINEVIRALAPFLDRLLGSRVHHLAAELAPAPLLVLADPSRFEQVVINLAVNGRDSMPSGGVLTLRTKAVVPADIAQMGRPAPFPGDGVLLTVQDNGHGIDTDTQRRVFDPFYTTKPAGRGAGLGLSSVFGTVRQGGGDVWISSAPGHGTTVSVVMPMAREPVR
jgi:PAS domain S-box-containing protein